MNVTIVWPPALTVTVAVPAARLLLTSNPALGNVLTPVTTVPAGIVSVITTEPAATVTGVHRCPWRRASRNSYWCSSNVEGEVSTDSDPGTRHFANLNKAGLCKYWLERGHQKKKGNGAQ